MRKEKRRAREGQQREEGKRVVESRTNPAINTVMTAAPHDVTMLNVSMFYARDYAVPLLLGAL